MAGRRNVTFDGPAEPIRISGRKMADNWWGLAWAKNLESYSDYSNRLPRGRTYVRNGSVIDLRIDGGSVKAKVSGSSPRPYTVTVDVDPLPENKRDYITERCANRVQNMEALVNGDIPQDVSDVFVSKDGLFPSPREIHFTCSCPDWAYMCKHVAAVLYGIGKKFDEDPMLFFGLRDFDVEPLIGRTVEKKIEMMLENAGKPSERIMDDDEIEGLFGRL